MLPSVAGSSHSKKRSAVVCPASTAERISPLEAMQCAKCPIPTTNVMIQMSMTEPVMECEPETSHATVAMIHPPTTPDQNACELEIFTASTPSSARACAYSGRRDPVLMASNANRNAPRTFDGKTMPHNRKVRR